MEKLIRTLPILKPRPRIPSLWKELAAILMRKQRPSALAAANYPVGASFPVDHGPLSSILVPIVLIGLIGDIPLSFVVVALSHAIHPMVIHIVIAATYLLSLGWAMAVRSTLRSMPHVVNGDALWLGGCVRTSGVIPKDAIAGSTHLRVSRFEWMSERGISRKDIFLASGFDPPNVVVEIKPDVSGKVRIGTRRGDMPARRWILLYADNPLGLVEVIRARQAGSVELTTEMAGI